MNIEQHVPKLETCQKLQEAGWKSHGFNHWVYDDYEKEWIVVCCQSMDSGRKIKWYPAPLLSELLEVLQGSHFHKEGDSGVQDLVLEDYGNYGEDNEWRIFYDIGLHAESSHNNPAEAAAQLVLTLVEEGILTL